MTIEDDKGRTIGDAECQNCGAPVAVKINKKGHLYYNCGPVADGGCLLQVQCRSATSDAKLAAVVDRWRSPEDRKRFQAEAAPEPEPDDDDTAPESDDDLDDDDQDEAPEPPPPPRRAARVPVTRTAASKPKPPRAAPPKKKSFWDTEF